MDLINQSHPEPFDNPSASSGHGSGQSLSKEDGELWHSPFDPSTGSPRHAWDRQDNAGSGCFFRYCVSNLDRVLAHNKLWGSSLVINKNAVCWSRIHLVRHIHQRYPSGRMREKRVVRPFGPKHNENDLFLHAKHSIFTTIIEHFITPTTLGCLTQFVC